MRGIRSHLTYANVVATLALMIAIGAGTAYAANTVFSIDIVDGEVKTPDIAPNAVGTGKIGKNQVFSDDVRDDTLSGGGLTAVDLAPDSVGTSEIPADAVRGSEIATGAVGGDALQNAHVHPGTPVNVDDPAEFDGDWHRVTANSACNPGEQMVGYYAEWTSDGDEVATREIVPNFATDSVTAQGISDDGGTETFRAAAVCVAG